MKKVLKKIFIDGFTGMTQGMFVTLIMGTAFVQIGTWIGGYIGAQFIIFGNIARLLTGAGIGVGVASEKQIAELIRKELLQEFDTVVIRLQNMSVGTEELTGRMWKLAGGSKDFD